jgi:hypothetical protein
MRKFKQFEAQEETSFEDDMQHVSSEIRRLGNPYRFKNLQVSIEEDHILVEVVMNKTEKFNQLSRFFYFIEQVKNQILVGFEVDMDLWETKKGDPIFTLEFYMKSKQPTTQTKYMKDWEDFYDDDLPY